MYCTNDIASSNTAPSLLLTEALGVFCGDPVVAESATDSAEDTSAVHFKLNARRETWFRF